MNEPAHFLKEGERQGQAVAAAELRVFYYENRLARACPNRQPYWQRQLNAAWRRLTRQQKVNDIPFDGRPGDYTEDGSPADYGLEVW